MSEPEPVSQPSDAKAQERMAQAREIQTRFGDGQLENEASIYSNNTPLRRAVMDIQVQNEGITRLQAVDRAWKLIRDVQMAKPGYLEEFRALYGLDASSGWIDREEGKDRLEWAPQVPAGTQ